MSDECLKCRGMLRGTGCLGGQAGPGGMGAWVGLAGPGGHGWAWRGLGAWVGGPGRHPCPHTVAHGGNCTNRATTRRRHAVKQLLMLQNPPITRQEGTTRTEQPGHDAWERLQRPRPRQLNHHERRLGSATPPAAPASDVPTRRVTNPQHATRVEGAGGPDGATGSRRIKVAHNFPRSVFKRRSKRCNSNDANSRFEAAAGELRATLPRNHACDRPRGPDLSSSVHVKDRVSACVTVTDDEPQSRPRKGLGHPATNTHPDRKPTSGYFNNLSTSP